MDAALVALFAALGWAAPISTAFIGFALIFKKPIERAIDRIKKFGFGSGAAEMAAESQQQQIEKADISVLPNEKPARTSLPPPAIGYIQPLEADLTNWLKSTAPDDAHAQLAWAVRTAVNIHVDREMEVTYRLIWGSQIAVLREMNISGGSLPIARIKQIYEFAKARFPDLLQIQTFEDWGRFIIARNLVTEPDLPLTDNSRSSLTEVGRAFLRYMVDKGLSEMKHG